ncbi:MAG: transcription termination factor NusA, partial [Planctomycetes bacterium]|nr:transcription termination factor NusA [Planctomycetota bacterium]
FDKHHRRARIIVPEDQLSLAIGKKGQNVRLSSKLTGWDLDIMTVDEHRRWRELGREEIASLPGVGDSMINNMLLTGFESFRDIVELGVEELTNVKGIGEKKAEEIYNFAVEGYHSRMEAEAKAAAEARAAKESGKAAPAEVKPAQEASLEESLAAPAEEATDEGGADDLEAALAESAPADESEAKEEGE